MYFDASERIAHKTNYSRSQIEKIDDFLAGQDVKRFELRQLQEKTEIYTDVLPILEAYVRARVLTKKTTYLCPEHLVGLEPVNRNEGRCIDCDRVYPFEDCPQKILYERGRKPDRQKIHEVATSQAETVTVPWWRDARFVIGILVAVVVALIGVVGSILGGDTINIFYPSDTLTLTSVIEQTADPTVATTETANPDPTFLPTQVPSDAPSESVTTDGDLTPEVTSEVTPELEVTEESSQE